MILFLNCVAGTRLPPVHFLNCAFAAKGMSRVE